MTFFRTILLSLGLGAAALPAAAQNAANGSSFGDWQLICEAVAVNTTACVLRQRLTRRDDGAFLAEVALRRAETPEGPRTVMILATPTGMLLPMTPGIRIDEAAETLPMQWRTCGPEACQAWRILEPGDIDALRLGAKLAVGYQPIAADKPVLFSLSLNGVTAGLQALEN